MSLVTRIRLQVIWAQIKRGWLAVLIVAFLIIGVSSYLTSSLSILSKALQDPVTATLIGAVIGGVMAFWGSVYVQQAEVKSLAAIRRKDEIFIPLYNELLSLRQSLHETPCPFEIAAREGANSHLPVFSIWPAFKADSRSLQVPKPLANALNQLATTIESYARAREAAVEDQQVDAVIRRIIVSAIGEQHAKRVDLTGHYLPCNHDLSGITHLLEVDASLPDKPGRLVQTMTHEQPEGIAEKIYRECSTINSVKQVQIIRKAIDDRLDELIVSLEIVIRFINERFEQHERWF